MDITKGKIWNKPLKRLWISSSTDKAIKDGFKNLKEASKYENLYNSAIARAEADWIVGINPCSYNKVYRTTFLRKSTNSNILCNDT